MIRIQIIPLAAVLMAGCSCTHETILGDTRADPAADPTVDPVVDVPVDAPVDVPVEDVEDAVDDCVPGHPECEGENVVDCGEVLEWCDPGRGEMCLDGECIGSCEVAGILRSNLGCTFWAVDLDNIATTEIVDAASQQFAVIAVNPGREAALVTADRNDADPGETPVVHTVDEQTIDPGEMAVILLHRREVDGSTPAGLNDGTGTALTPNAYRITSTRPVAAFQFNPLDETLTVAGDASMLIPQSYLHYDSIVLGWPQTLVNTPGNPDTDMGDDLRAFVTIVGTQSPSSVQVTLPSDGSLRVLGDGVSIPDMGPGDVLEVTLGEFEVLNLETDGFLSDLTGTLVSADRPVAVFSGAEAADVPTWGIVSERTCCADHLEEQLPREGISGSEFVVGLTPSRIEAVRLAGGTVEDGDEVELFRILALEDATIVRTTLPSPDDRCTLDRGEHRTLASLQDFHIAAGRPVLVGQFVAGRYSTPIPWDQPAGDPSFIMVPAEEHWRRTHVFATPSTHPFDFLVITHPVGADIHLDGEALPSTCEETVVAGTAGERAVTRCQLSFPEIDLTCDPLCEILDGRQDDGVHVVTSDVPVGVVVYGFAYNSSYGYPAGFGQR